MKKLGVLAVGVLVLFSACDKIETACKEEKQTACSVSEFPDSLQVGTQYDVVVDYVLESSCGSFDRFEIIEQNGRTQVKMHTKYEGCSCQLELTEQTAKFPVKFESAGYYEFSFWLSDEQWDTYILEVYQ